MRTLNPAQGASSLSLFELSTALGNAAMSAVAWFLMSSAIAQAAAEDMIIEKDVPIVANDGLVLRANVYRPAGAGKHPVIMTYGPYGKDWHWADAYKEQWDYMMRVHPEICRNGSQCKHIAWEAVDPERWVPKGYAVVMVDSRGSGKSPGFLDPFSTRETQDYYDCIEWAGVQLWSNGKVGLAGVGYFAINQWMVAALQPPHLAAMIPWEGFVDHYRDSVYTGGIFASAFAPIWMKTQVLVNQHGNANSPWRDRSTGERTTGPALSEDLLAGNRIDFLHALSSHPLNDAFHRQRTPDFSRIEVPLLSAGNWGGMGLHLRGNVEGFVRSASTQKWLEMHTEAHYEAFYLPDSVALQQKFFDYYLKGIDNGWNKEPPVHLAIRRPDGMTHRTATAWPLPNTQWTRFYLDTANRTLITRNPKKESIASYDGLGEGIVFSTPPFEKETEITGPVMARLWVSSTTTDMDVFLTLQVFDPAGKEVVFRGSSAPAVPVTQGWLRASHRKLDPVVSTPYQPYHTHDEIQKLVPGELYPLDIEILPTSMVFPRGYRLVLRIEGRDFGWQGASGIEIHGGRDPAEFGGKNSVISGGTRESYLLLPVQK